MRILAALAALAFGLTAGLAAAGAFQREDVERIDIRFSRFDPRAITVRVGEPITFLLENQDPIEHEWIVGPEAVHELHRSGTHPKHDEIPTEVTLPPLSERRTTVVFNSPGAYRFICHLPGHEAYGMTGTVVVLP